MFLQIILLAATLSFAAAPPGEFGRKCGLKTAPCPEDMVCVANSRSCWDLDRCPGHCEFKNKYKGCGDFTPTPHTCDEGFECQDDPRFPDSCGMACDAPGICLPKNTSSCGGHFGRACPTGLYCYDALDGCDPYNGGADCPGICV